MAHIAALHCALWSFDRWYRLAWRISPLSAALLILGWIVLEKPAATGSAWGGKAANAAPAQSAGNSTAVGKRPATQLLTPFPENLRDDTQRCYDNTPDVNHSIEACSRLISSGLLTDEQLVAAYNQRGFYYSGS
jgi:hypothetical protein